MEQQNPQPSLEQLTPEQIEQGMLEKEKSEPNPLDNHAAFCHMYFPKMVQLMEKLNKKALMRVMELAIKYPIEDSDKNFKSETERHLFNTMNQLLTSKYIMVIHTAGEEMRKQEEEKAKLKEEKEVNG